MRSARSLRYGRCAIPTQRTRGFCAEWPTTTRCWWWHEALPEPQLLCQESSSCGGRWLIWQPTFVVVCWPLGWIWPSPCWIFPSTPVGVEAVFQLAPLSPLREGTAISCQQWITGRVLHCGSQPAALEVLNQSAPAVSCHVHHWQLGLAWTPTTKHACFPSGLPSFLPEPHRLLRWVSQTQLKCRGAAQPFPCSLFLQSAWDSHARNQPAHFSARFPTPLHCHPWVQTSSLQTKYLECLYFMTEMYKIALVL